MEQIAAKPLLHIVFSCVLLSVSCVFLYNKRRKPIVDCRDDGRLEDVNMNSRGLLCPRNLTSAQNGVCKDANRQRGFIKRYSFNLKIVAVPRLCRRHFLPYQFFHGFKNPRLFALSGFASFRRIIRKTKRVPPHLAVGRLL